MMDFVEDDGGRAAAGYKGYTGDCVCRSIAIATQQDYKTVYDALNRLAKKERITKRSRRKSSARDGVKRSTMKKYMIGLGWTWVPTMLIGQGCKVHLVDGELPMGRLVVSLSRHMTAVIDGVIHDTHDPQRYTLITENGITRITNRCVYGYFYKG